MSVESPADQASMFDENEFAEGADYRAPGGGTAVIHCAVIYDRGQGRAPFDSGNSRAATSERHLWVRKGDLPAVVRGGTFTLDLDGELVKVSGLPKLDQSAAIWSVELVLVV